MTLIDQLPIDGRTVLIRVDFNAPLDSDGEVVDDSRIRAALPTIKHAIERKSRIILASHCGRPKGKRDPALSLAGAGSCLAGLLECDVILSDRPVGDGPTRLAKDLRDGQILLLENLRFHAGETRNDDSFARQLAALTDFYVNDAFGTAHRAHASTVGIARHVRDKAAGYLMAKEIKALSTLLTAPKSGFVAVLGGAKVSDKITVLQQLIPKIDTLIIGGAMAYTFLAAQGIEIGASKVEKSKIGVAKDILRDAKLRGVRVLLPTDHACAESFSPDAERVLIHDVEIPRSLMALDIGEQTATRFSAALAGAKTIFWNGPMGVFEFDAFAVGTRAVADAVANSAAWSVVGGGDSVSAVNQLGHAAGIDHISTGGGASLEFIEGRDLPGLLALGIRRS